MHRSTDSLASIEILRRINRYAQAEINTLTLYSPFNARFTYILYTFEYVFDLIVFLYLIVLVCTNSNQFDVQAQNCINFIEGNFQEFPRYRCAISWKKKLENLHRKQRREFHRTKKASSNLSRFQFLQIFWEFLSIRLAQIRNVIKVQRPS